MNFSTTFKFIEMHLYLFRTVFACIFAYFSPDSDNILIRESNIMDGGLIFQGPFTPKTITIKINMKI